MKDGIANISSGLFHPLLIPLYGVLAYYFYDTSPMMPSLFKLVVASLVTVFMVLLPVLWYFLLYKTGVLSSVKASERKDRYWLYSFSLVCYAVTVGGLFFIRNIGFPVDSSIIKVLCGSCASLCVAFVVNFFWKISAHATAIGGLTGAAMFITQSYGDNSIAAYCILILLSACIINARLQLKAHTGWQLLAGYMNGAAFCGIFPFVSGNPFFF